MTASTSEIRNVNFNAESLTDNIKKLPKVVKAALAAISMLSAYAFLPTFLYPISFCAIVYYTAKIWNQPIPPRIIENKQQPQSLFFRIYNYLFVEQTPISQTNQDSSEELPPSTPFPSAPRRYYSQPLPEIRYTTVYTPPASQRSPSRQPECSNRIPVGSGQTTQVQRTSSRGTETPARIPVGNGQTTPVSRSSSRELATSAKIPVGNGENTPEPRTGVKRQNASSTRIPVGSGERTPIEDLDKSARIQVGSRK